MNNRGYIYILANGSMPNLIKIGKTTRSSAKRVEELSSHTGVPTRFILVYEQFFEDCSVAEDYLHTTLSKYRHEKNREFFRVSASKVVHIILKMSGRIDAFDAAEADEIFVNDSELKEIESYGNTLCKNALSYRLGLFIPQDKEKAIDLYRQAAEQGSLEGYKQLIYFADLLNIGNEPQDTINLYKEAALLGYSKAYEKLGMLYAYGDGVPKNRKKAFDYYKEGGKRGNYYCWLKMATTLFYEDTSNYSRCIKLFFKHRKIEMNKTILDDEYLFSLYCIQYIEYCLRKKLIPIKDGVQQMKLIKKSMVEYLKKELKGKQEEYFNLQDIYYKKTLQWVRENL